MLIFPILLVLMLFAQDTQPEANKAAAGGEQISSPVVQDDAWGECPAFSHYHDLWPRYEGGLVMDGKCHADTDDSPLGDRKVLPNPRDKWL